MRSSRRFRTTGRRAILAVLCASICVSAFAAPAAAHWNRRNYVTAVTDVEPRIMGLDVWAAADGSSLTISNQTGRTVIVLGYDHEQYLKIAEDGVWQNERSPATYLNTKGSGPGRVPGFADPLAPPQWQKVGSSNVWQYHEDRIVWSGKSRPDVVVKSPNQRHLIKTWTIGLIVGGIPAVINGTLSWSPSRIGTSYVVFIVICLSVAVAFGVAIALDARRRNSPAVDPTGEVPVVSGAVAPDTASRARTTR